MRHFEDFEIEHLFNSTGSIWLRWRCRMHIRHCDICRSRMERVIADRNFADRFKSGIEHLRALSKTDNDQS